VGQPIIVVHEAETYSAEISQHSSYDGAMREAVLMHWLKTYLAKGLHIELSHAMLNLKSFYARPVIGVRKKV
jgi:hypothetical protein